MSRLRQSHRTTRPSSRSASTHPAFGQSLDRCQRLADGGFELPQPHEDDLLFLVGHRFDGHRQARGGRSHLHPVSQVGATVSGGEAKPPGRRGVAGFTDRPGEFAWLVAGDDLRSGAPLSERVMLVVPDEAGPDPGGGGSLDPLNGLQLTAERRHQLDIGDQTPDSGRFGVDPRRGFHRWLVCIACTGPFHATHCPPPGPSRCSGLTRGTRAGCSNETLQSRSRLERDCAVTFDATARAQATAGTRSAGLASRWSPPNTPRNDGSFAESGRVSLTILRTTVPNCCSNGPLL